MSKYKDIDKVVKIFRDNKCKFTMLHCVSEYPCEEKNINLINMIYLKKRYKCRIGYSGHESSLTPSVVFCNAWSGSNRKTYYFRS